MNFSNDRLFRRPYDSYETEDPLTRQPPQRSFGGMFAVPPSMPQLPQSPTGQPGSPFDRAAAGGAPGAIPTPSAPTAPAGGYSQPLPMYANVKPSAPVSNVQFNTPEQRMGVTGYGQGSAAQGSAATPAAPAQTTPPPPPPPSNNDSYGGMFAKPKEVKDNAIAMNF